MEILLGWLGLAVYAAIIGMLVFIVGTAFVFLHRDAAMWEWVETKLPRWLALMFHIIIPFD